MREVRRSPRASHTADEPITIIIVIAPHFAFFIHNAPQLSSKLRTTCQCSTLLQYSRRHQSCAPVIRRNECIRAPVVHPISSSSMTDSQRPPLNYMASSNSEPHISHTLPPEVITCLKNARFVWLHSMTQLRKHFADPCTAPSSNM